MKMQIHSLPLGAALEAVKNSCFSGKAVHKAELRSQTLLYMKSTSGSSAPMHTHVRILHVSMLWMAQMRVFVYSLYWSGRDTSGDINVCRLTNEDERHLQNCSEITSRAFE